MVLLQKKVLKKIWLSNKPVVYKRIEMYPLNISVVFKNGMARGAETICYDLLKMNEIRVSDGLDPSPAIVSDF
ncbi:MAG: hypothetical protein ACTHXT_15675 [Sphingobacterium sp.]